MYGRRITTHCILRRWLGELCIVEIEVALRLIPEEHHFLSSSNLNFRQQAELVVVYQICCNSPTNHSSYYANHISAILSIVRSDQSVILLSQMEKNSCHFRYFVRVVVPSVQWHQRYNFFPKTNLCHGGDQLFRSECKACCANPF